MLTDKQVPTAKARDKASKLANRNSLSLRLSPRCIIVFAIHTDLMARISCWSTVLFAFSTNGTDSRL